jgi:predicted ABC-type ATPase
MRNSKRLRVFSGPNGSGKSTIYNAVKEYFNEIPFVNADIIESKLLNDGFVNLLDFQIKIESRYYKTLENLLPSIKHCYRVYFFDTSSKNKLELFAELYQDKLEIHSDNIPNWFYHYVLNPIYKL